MEPIAYLHLQMRLEGKSPSSGCFMRQVEIVPDEEMPLMLIARLANEELVAYYDEAISPALQKQLSAIDIDFSKVDILLAALKRLNIQCEMGHYKTYVFSSQPLIEVDALCLSKHDPKVKAFGFDGFANEVHTIADGDRIVSACVSTRENEDCGEAWVYTVPEYRKCGFAQKVVRAWAHSLMEAGKVPFYSHNITNEASANLARKLGLRPIFDEITITQIK